MSLDCHLQACCRITLSHNSQSNPQKDTGKAFRISEIQLWPFFNLQISTFQMCRLSAGAPAFVNYRGPPSAGSLGCGEAEVCWRISR